MLMLFLLSFAGCTGDQQPLPTTPAVLNLSLTERAVFRDGFRAGRDDVRRHLSAEHKRHSFPAASEDAFRCGYIRGLTYYWLAFGKEERIRREVPAYSDAYSKQLVHW